MPPTTIIYSSYAAPINPPGATPVLTREQVWAGLELKVEHAQDFVPAIVSTDVIAYKEDQDGRKVTQREVVFKEGNRRMKEDVTMYWPTKVVFVQPEGSRVQNIISNGADGQLLMTYDFEWRQPDLSEADVPEYRQKYAKMAEMAVEQTIISMRKMVVSGRIK